jgi:hypothetical protein
VLLHRAAWAQAVSWRFVREDLDNLYKPLPVAMPLADCKWLKGELAAIQQRIAQLAPDDVHRFKDRVSSEGPKLQAAIKQLEKEIKSADKDFEIGSISTVVGCVLSLLGLVFTAEVAVGAAAALVAAQLFAVVGFAAWSLIENPSSGAKILVGYGRDKTLTLAGIVADQGKTFGARLCSKGLAVLGPFISAKEALESHAAAQDARKKLNDLLAQMRAFDAEVQGLPLNDDKKLLEEVLKPMYASTAAALKAFIADNEAHNCQIPQPKGPILQRP